MTATVRQDVADSPGLPILLILAGLGMVGPFSIDTIFPAFSQMGADLAVGEVALQQLVSVYLLAFAGMSLLHGPLSDALGRKPVILAGTVVYIAASIGCALSQSLPMLLAFRALQGLSAGAGQIISRAMVRDIYHGDRAQKVMSQIAMIFGLAPAVAPIVGGWILGWGNWRAIFWFLVGFGVLLVVAVAFVLPETHPSERRTPLRLAPLVGGLVGVLHNPGGRRLAGTTMLSFAGMFLYISSAPLIIVGRLGRGAGDFWMLFVPLIGGMVVGSWVSGRLAGRLSGRRMASAGYVISLFGVAVTLALSFLPAGAGIFPWSLVALPVFTFGVAISFPVLTLAMLDLFPHSRGAASSVQSFSQLLFNALIAGVFAPILGQSLTWLAAASLVFTLAGATQWQHHLRVTNAQPVAPSEPAALEPTEDM